MSFSLNLACHNIVTNSLLPQLQPIIGISFALNLAYLGLPRFRYRDEIKRNTKSELEELDSNGNGFKETDWWCTLERLAGERVGSAGAKRKGKIPREFWGVMYELFFERRVDIYISFFLCLFTGLLAILGVAHEIDYLKSTEIYFTSPYIPYCFWVVASSGFLPPVWILSGRSVVGGARQYACDQIADMKKVKQVEVQNITLPEGL